MSTQILTRPMSVARYCPGAGFDFCGAVQDADFVENEWNFKGTEPNRGSLAGVTFIGIDTNGLVKTYNTGTMVAVLYDSSDVQQSTMTNNFTVFRYIPDSTVYVENGWYLEIVLDLTLVTGHACSYTYRQYLTGYVNSQVGDFDARDFDARDFLTGI